MRKAVYPERSCRQPVWGQNDAASSCDLPEEHRGPCASFSVRSSVQAREAWEKAHPEQVNEREES